MAWGSKQTATQLTGVGTTETFFDLTPQLTPGELVHVQITADNEDASTVTDDLEVRVYTTLDDSTEDWDEHPDLTLTISPDGVSAENKSFRVSGVYKFRVGVTSSGSTDTYTADMAVREDGVSL